MKQAAVILLSLGLNSISFAMSCKVVSASDKLIPIHVELMKHGGQVSEASFEPYRRKLIQLINEKTEGVEKALLAIYKDMQNDSNNAFDAKEGEGYRQGHQRAKQILDMMYNGLELFDLNRVKLKSINKTNEYLAQFAQPTFSEEFKRGLTSEAVQYIRGFRAGVMEFYPRVALEEMPLDTKFYAAIYRAGGFKIDLTGKVGAQLADFFVIYNPKGAFYFMPTVNRLTFGRLTDLKADDVGAAVQMSNGSTYMLPRERHEMSYELKKKMEEKDFAYLDKLIEKIGSVKGKISAGSQDTILEIAIASQQPEIIDFLRNKQTKKEGFVDELYNAAATPELKALVTAIEFEDYGSVVNISNKMISTIADQSVNGIKAPHLAKVIYENLHGARTETNRNYNQQAIETLFRVYAPAETVEVARPTRGLKDRAKSWVKRRIGQ